MKKFLFRRMASVALASALAISAVPAWGIGTVEAAEEDILTIYASEINEAFNSEGANTEKGYPGDGYTLTKDGLIVNANGEYGEVVLELDEDLHINDVTIYGTTTIIGGHALYLDKDSVDSDMEINGKLTVKQGSRIVIDSSKADVLIKDYKGVSGSLYSSGEFIFNQGDQVYADGSIYIYDGEYKANNVGLTMFNAGDSLYVKGGNFTADGLAYRGTILGAEKNINISGGTFDCKTRSIGISSYNEGDINITGGDINITSEDGYAIHSYQGNVNISGGKVVTTVEAYSGIYGDNFCFSGGYLEISDPKQRGSIEAKSFELAEDYYIAEPECAKYVKSEKTIVSKENEIPTKVVITKGNDLSNIEISGVEDKAYTGSAITQNAVVTFDGTTLTEGTDYVIEYSDNTEVGTATMTFMTGENGKYYGTASKTFQITKADDDKKDDVKKDDDQKDGDKKDDDKKDDKKDDNKAEKKYSNEWVDGKWYDADGKQTYKGTMSWKSNDKGWWIEDSEGWYPQSQWQKIDGKWYYFCADGYMDYSEYRDGCWLGSDGAWVEEYYGGTWKQNSTGWWYEDASGWYPQSQWVWIDGSQYYFGADGYWDSSK